MEDKSVVDVLHLLDVLDQSVLVVDPDLKVLFHNQPASDLHELLDFPEGDSSQSLLDVVPSQSATRMTRLIQSVFSNGETEVSTIELKNKSNRSVYLESRYTPLRVGGEVTYVCITTRDISQKKIFEARIRSAGEELANLIENANAIIFSIDSRGYVTEWNSKCVEMLGYEKADAYTMKFSDEIVPIPYQEDFLRTTSYVLDGKSVSNKEVMLLTKSGCVRTLLVSLMPRVNSTGHTIGMFLIGHDITELIDYRRSLERKVEQRTQELRKALNKEKEITQLKTRLVSIASHEFKTPLSSIMLIAEQIKSSSASIETGDLESRMDNILRSVHHMKALLEDVLTLGRSEAPKVSLQISEIPFHSFLTELIDEVYKGTRQTHQIKLNFLLNENIVILSDEKLLRTVLSNLLTNAVKYSPGRDRVEIDVRMQDSELTVSVQDYGIGIDPEELDTIFEPFTRAGNVSKIQGTGLGLSIAKRAVDLLGGQIGVVSEPGAQTCFTVSLPLTITDH